MFSQWVFEVGFYSYGDNAGSDDAGGTVLLY